MWTFPSWASRPNACGGVRTSVTTPLDAVVQGATITYGVDVPRNRSFHPVDFETRAH
jgi:hypothetical protein